MADWKLKPTVVIAPRLRDGVEMKFMIYSGGEQISMSPELFHALFERVDKEAAQRG